MLDKETAKEKLRELVEQFASASRNHEFIDEKNEEWVKWNYIEPLIEILGWSRQDIEKEQRVLKGRADYILKLGNEEVLVIEAKKSSANLSEEEGRQAVSYAYHRKIKFAILTNFNEIKVYHALSNIKNIDNNLLKFGDNSLFRIPFGQFLENFDKLLLLSKESFEKGEINKLLSKKDEKVNKPIDVNILNDLLKIREWLSKELKSKKKYLDVEIDEIVQILIDRLIFIRSIEDRGLEPMNYLKSLEADVRQQRVKLQLFPYLIEKFKEFNVRYDSKLFESGILEKEGAFSDEVLRKIILALYFGVEGNQERYLFDQIPVDLFGSIYEQYLGTILQVKEKRVKLESESGKRKKMGIYYTPSYIVDYIVKNTVGEYIKDKTIDEILDVRIVDPACGSGSFLVRAFQEVCNAIEKKLEAGEKSAEYKTSFNEWNGKLTFGEKIVILKNCIYGVDLDEKAVELTHLNLILTTLDGETAELKTRKLPEMSSNLKNGNSLIDDAKIAGDKAFKWEAQFPEIFRNGGFDVVVGNPPYVKARGLEGDKARSFIEKSGKFVTPYKMWDLYIPFVEKGLQILNKNGKFGMIIPDTIGISDYTSKLASLILKDYHLYQIDFFPNIKVFESATVSNKIIFVSKKKSNYCKKVFHEGKIDRISSEVIVKEFNENIFKAELSKINLSLDGTLQLKDFFYVSYGARFNSDRDDPKKFKKEELLSDKQDKIHSKAYTEGKFIERYFIKKKLFVEWNTERCPKRLVRPTFEQLYLPAKLLLSRQKRVATISLEGEICDNTIIVAVPFYEFKGLNNSNISKYLTNIGISRETLEENSQKLNLRYVLGIINSKLISYFLKFNSTGKIDVYPDDWKTIPIKLTSKQQEKIIVSLVDQMLALQKKLHEGKPAGNEKERLEQQIKNVDYEIDQEVYKLYGLTKEEIRIVEESLK